MRRESLGRLLAGIDSFYTEVGTHLAAQGGYLRCETCGATQALDEPGEYVRHGWPRCCNLTMRWWTQRQIDAGEAPPRMEYR